MRTLLASTGADSRRWWRRATAGASAAVLALAGLATGAVPAQADGLVPMSVTVTPSATQLASGSPLTYTIDALNDPGARADEVTMTFQAPGMTGPVAGRR